VGSIYTFCTGLLTLYYQLLVPIALPAGKYFFVSPTNELLILLPGTTNSIRGFQIPPGHKKLAGRMGD
jgi:hypothetical protein